MPEYGINTYIHCSVPYGIKECIESGVDPMHVLCKLFTLVPSNTCWQYSTEGFPHATITVIGSNLELIEHSNYS